MVTLVARNATALFNTSGKSDGLVFVDGVRGTTQSSGGWLGTIQGNALKIDYVPSLGTASVGVGFSILVDSLFNPFNPTSGNTWQVVYAGLGQSAGQDGIMRADSWKVT